MRWSRYRRKNPKKYSSKERNYYKRHLMMARFLNHLSTETLKEIVTTFIGGELLRVNNRRTILRRMLSDRDFILSTEYKDIDNNPIRFALKFLLSAEEMEELLDLLELKPKRTHLATCNAIYSSLQFAPELPLDEVASARAEAQSLKQRAALAKARKVRGERDAEVRERATEVRRSLGLVPQPPQPPVKRKKKRKWSPARREAVTTRLLPKVVEFLLEKMKAEYRETTLSMKGFAASRNYPYTGFTRLVKRYGNQAQPEAKAQFVAWRRKVETPVYQQHVINYLAEKEFRRDEGVLSRKQFAEEQGVDAETLNLYYKEFRLDPEILAAARRRFRDLEEGRLSSLRKGIEPSTAKDKFESIFHPEPAEPIKASPDLILLEKLARAPLEMRKGLPLFSHDPTEQNRKLEMWLEIAEDVMEMGLIDAVIETYAQEFLLPEALSDQQRLWLIRLEMQKVLRQLDIYDPSKQHLTFERLRRWKERREAKKALKHTPEPEPEIEPKPSVEDDEVYDEAWLEREIAREEAEARRFLATDEERERRRSAGLIYEGQLDRAQIEAIQSRGAIYESGSWLLAAQEDLDKLQTKSSRMPSWTAARKPRLLVGIGTTDYTKQWMKDIFELRTVSSSSKAKGAIRAYKPDALMIYTSSTGRSLQRVFAEIAREDGIPLITFERGFSDALQSAERQNLSWFIEAYRNRRREMRRYNPFRSHYRNRRFRRFRRFR